jgi:hypothetical protein
MAHKTSGTMPTTSSELRTSAQARIAASAPKMTYGKHKNKLLPLTGSQFLRSDVYGITEQRVVAKESTCQCDQESSADDSPLSDAEPSYKQQHSRLVVTRKKLNTMFNNLKRSTPETGDNGGTDFDTTQEECLSRPRQPDRKSSGAGHPRPHHSTVSAQQTGKLKSPGVVRGPLPLNELVLVPGAHDDPFKIATKTRDLMARDHTSSVKPLHDAVDSSDSEVTHAKRKAQAPLSAIRKRLRTQSSGHKSLEYLRSKYNAAQITPTGSRVKQLVGDGFERSEHTPSHSSGYTTMHARRQRGPLLAGLQALSLASGPLPEVIFIDNTNTSQLGFGQPETFAPDKAASGRDEQVTVSALLGEPSRSSNRRVSFMHDAEAVILAQLASVSAPKREPSITLDCDDENNDDDDDGDNDGDESDNEDEDDEEDDEAADTYLDQDESSPEDDHVMDENMQDIQHHLPQTTKKSGVSARGPSDRPQDELQPTGSIFDGVVADSSRPRTFNSNRRTFSGKPLLSEVDEMIDDDFCVDSMLLPGDEERRETYTTRNNKFNGIGGLADGEDFAPSASKNQTVIRQTSSIQPRSILKNSTPHISSGCNRPDSTAVNTRRNSFVDLEDSRYFSAAKYSLDSAPTEQPIIRMKSSSRFWNPTEVPYNGDVVHEASSRKPDYTNASKLHLLRHTNDALWTSSAALVSQRDLKSLTRSVSKDNGTLSQPVRRRSSLRFQSPRRIIGD